MFTSDMGVFLESDFYNWNKAKSVVEFLYTIDLYPLILIDNSIFDLEKYKAILESFLEYFSDIDYFDIKNFKFQFINTLDQNIKLGLRSFLNDKYEGIDVLIDDFILHKTSNRVFDTIYMLPYIIHNTINYNKSLDFLRAYDVLEKQTKLTNEIFIGSPGIVNDMNIRKPAYYAYYFLSKLGDTIVFKDDGYIVTKKDDEYAILLYSYTEDLNELKKYDELFTKRGSKNVYKKRVSLNIQNIKSSSRIITYEISEKFGSSYNYWLSMGSPDRLNKEEKEILHKASFPKIDFKYMKKNPILNIITELNGYSAKLILIKNIK